MNVNERIAKAINYAKLSYQGVTDLTGIPKATIFRYTNGSTKKISIGAIKKIASACGVSSAWLMGYDVPMLEEGETIDYSSVGSVAAGYGRTAVEDISETYFSIPADIIKGYSKEDFMLLTVSGDSMFPTYEDGDKILVLYQPTCENGQVAVVKYDEDNATLKKVFFNGNSIVLKPINPDYPEITIKGQRLSNFSIIGVPKYLTRRL